MVADPQLAIGVTADRVAELTRSEEGCVLGAASDLNDFDSVRAESRYVFYLGCTLLILLLLLS